MTRYRKHISYFPQNNYKIALVKFLSKKYKKCSYFTLLKINKQLMIPRKKLAYFRGFCIFFLEMKVNDLLIFIASKSQAGRFEPLYFLYTISIFSASHEFGIAFALAICINSFFNASMYISATCC